MKTPHYVSIRPLNNPKWDAGKASIFTAGSAAFRQRTALYTRLGWKFEIVDATERRNAMAARFAVHMAPRCES